MNDARSTLSASLLVLFAAQACSFEAASPSGATKANSCTQPSDCSTGSDCKQGLCVARSADEPLDIALVVTPQRGTTNADAQPIVLPSFVVSRPVDRQFSLPGTIGVNGMVRNSLTGGDAALDAQVTFTPTDGIAGIGVKPVTATTTASGNAKSSDYAVTLVSGVQYRMLVRPSDPTLPPYTRTFTAGDGADLSLDYGSIAMEQRTFLVTGAPSDRMLLATALDAVTSEPVSSTAMVGADGGFTLSFGPHGNGFRIELRAAQALSGAANTAAVAKGPCDVGAPAFPVFSIADHDLQRDANGVSMVTLPAQPDRIRYEGTIDLCKEQASKANTVGTLPVALHSRSLVLDPGTPFTAAFDATTDASYDATSHAVRFCVVVMAGTYDVVVTPPPDLACALFAEQRLVQAPDGVSASGALLEMPSAAYLAGTLQTTDLVPLKGAAVEAAALARDDVLDLATGDPSVTRFNRSQQTTTAADGGFKLPVDLGSYDVVIRPPADSGFPWQVRHDVDIGARGMEFAAVIDMLSPVALKGTLAAAHTSGTTPVRAAAAAIDAYAIIEDGNGKARAIAVGKTTADGNGQFMLLLPPSTRRGW